MIPYELAKELKKAGFPQGTTQWVYTEVGREWPSSLILKQDSYGGAVATDAPTLEELIEACGEELQEMENTFDGWRTYMRSSAETFWAPELIVSVANLYLALNPKKV